MREQDDSARPGEYVTAELRASEDIPAGSHVEATDGPMGVVRERLTEGPEHAYLGVETQEGLLFVPERLVREKRGDTVFLSLPAADVRANSSVDGCCEWLGRTCAW
jgi:hypothetical protein